MKRYQFAAVPVEWTTGDLSAKELGVLTILLAVTDGKSGIATIDQTRLSERAGMSRPAVNAILKSLEEGKFVEKLGRYREGRSRGGRGLDYKINLPASVTAQAPTVETDSADTPTGLKLKKTTSADKEINTSCQNADSSIYDSLPDSSRPDSFPPTNSKGEGDSSMTLAKLLQGFRMSSQNAQFIAEQALQIRSFESCRTILANAHGAAWSREKLQSELLAPPIRQLKPNREERSNALAVPTRTVVDERVRQRRSELARMMRQGA